MELKRFKKLRNWSFSLNPNFLLENLLENPSLAIQRRGWRQPIYQKDPKHEESQRIQIFNSDIQGLRIIMKARVFLVKFQALLYQDTKSRYSRLCMDKDLLLSMSKWKLMAEITTSHKENLEEIWFQMTNPTMSIFLNKSKELILQKKGAKINKWIANGAILESLKRNTHLN